MKSVDPNDYGPQNADKIRAALDDAHPPGVASGPPLKLVPPARLSEDEVQTAIVRSLERRGYIVKVTSVRYHRQKCADCGQWQRPVGGTGQSEGIPDLLVSHERWPRHLWLGLEIKDDTGKLSLDQELLAAQERIALARSIPDAEDAVGRVEQFIARFHPPVLDRVRIDLLRVKIDARNKTRAERKAAARRNAPKGMPQAGL